MTCKCCCECHKPDPGVLVRVGDEVITSDKKRATVIGLSVAPYFIVVQFLQVYGYSGYLPNGLTFNGRPVRGFQDGWNDGDMRDAFHAGLAHSRVRNPDSDIWFDTICRARDEEANQ